MCWNHKQTNVMQFYDKFFHKNIASGPEYACSCCDQLWYNFGSDSNLKKGKFPSCSTANNSGFPYKPDHLVYPSCKSLELPRGGHCLFMKTLSIIISSDVNSISLSPKANKQITNHSHKT